MYQSSHNLKTSNMNKLVLISSLIIVLISSCATQKTTTYNNDDDIYANPTEDRKEEARLAVINKQQQDIADKRYSDSLAQIKMAQKVKDDANPAYKEREFKYDDYYDYEYATRVKRFNNNINGLSYYDNYYTNSYWYTNNPYHYGVSIYNGYSWWGNNYNNYSYNPQYNFYNNYGWNSYPNYGYNGYNPYNNYNPYGYGLNNSYIAGYNAGYNSGYFSGNYNYPYYSYGGYNPYGNGYNYNNLGYYNALDNNSQYSYGSRTSHGGGNSHRTSSAGMNTNTDNDSYYNRYASSVAEHQKQAVKFEPLQQVVITSENNPIKVDTKGTIFENRNNIKTNELLNSNGNISIHSNQQINNIKTNQNNSNTQALNIDNTSNNTSTHNNQIIKTKINNAAVYTAPLNSNTIDNENGIKNPNLNQSQNTINNQQSTINSEARPFRNQPIKIRSNQQEPIQTEYHEQNNYQTPPINSGASQPRNSDGGSGGSGRPR